MDSYLGEDFYILRLKARRILLQQRDVREFCAEAGHAAFAFAADAADVLSSTGM